LEKEDKMSEIRKRTTKMAEKSSITCRHQDYPAPKLSGPCLSFDLVAETQRLRKEGIWDLESHNAIALAKYDDLRVVLIAMKSGSRMEGHKAYGSISIHTLTGKLRIHLPNHTMDVVAENLVILERSLPHNIEALEDSSFLLSVSWARSA
jgi:quercetin dioxygenase-like cupin family protein